MLVCYLVSCLLMFVGFMFARWVGCVGVCVCLILFGLLFVVLVGGFVCVVFLFVVVFVVVACCWVGVIWWFGLVFDCLLGFRLVLV